MTSFPLGMATMKENKSKEVVDEGVKSQPRPPTGEKRKNISSRVDLGDLPSRRGKDKSTSLPNFKESSLLLPLVWSPLCRFSLLILSQRILRPGRSRPWFTHPPRLLLPRKFLNTF